MGSTSACAGPCDGRSTSPASERAARRAAAIASSIASAITTAPSSQLPSPASPPAAPAGVSRAASVAAASRRRSWQKSASCCPSRISWSKRSAHAGFAATRLYGTTQGRTGAPSALCALASPPPSARSPLDILAAISVGSSGTEGERVGERRAARAGVARRCLACASRAAAHTIQRSACARLPSCERSDLSSQTYRGLRWTGTPRSPAAAAHTAARVVVAALARAVRRRWARGARRRMHRASASRATA